MISGWITNKGKVIECEPYGHFTVDNDIIKSVWDPYKDELKEISDDCNSMSDIGEHPEWHRYEMSESDFEREALDTLYKKGFLRLGKMANSIVVAGYEKWIEQHKYVLKKLADKYECKLNIRKRDEIY